jgi:hypothetical protein
MGSAGEAVDLDRIGEPDKGEVVRGRNGSEDGEGKRGEAGDKGEGSVDRRKLAGL